MHGINRQASALELAAIDGWHPFIPGLFCWREVIRQLGYKPTLYVMRKRVGWKSYYRACSPAEASAIEFADLDKRYWAGQAGEPG